MMDDRTTPSLPFINGFWGGFDDPDGLPTPLDQTPQSVGIITMAFASPAAGNTLSTGYLCSRYAADTVKGWVKEAQAKGQKVLVSIMDTPDHHWADMDIPEFIKNAAGVIRGEWGLDGVDIDSESTDATGTDFAALANGFRRELGPDALITYDSYLFSADDQEVFKTAARSLSWVNLMAYFNPYDNMVDLFNTYAAVLGPSRVAIGVKPGTNGEDQSTPLDEVKRLAAFQPATGVKAGMMLYTLTMDLPFYTGQPIWTYLKAIATHLGLKTANGPGGTADPSRGS